MDELRVSIAIDRRAVGASQSDALNYAKRNLIMQMAVELEKYVTYEISDNPVTGKQTVTGRLYIAQPNEVRRVYLPPIGVKGLGDVGGREVIMPVDPVPVYNPDRAASDAHVARLLKVAVRKIQMEG